MRLEPRATDYEVSDTGCGDEECDDQAHCEADELIHDHQPEVTCEEAAVAA